MAGFASDSDWGSDFSYDLTTSDEELLLAAADQLSPVVPQSRPGPSTLARPSTTFAPSTLAQSSIPVSPVPDATLAIDETVAAVSDDDLTFDISELDGQGANHVGDSSHHDAAESQHSRTPTPPTTTDHGDLASFVSKTKPGSSPTLLSGPDVSYPDCKSFPAYACRTFWLTTDRSG